MNRIERLLGLKGEARIRYLDGEFQILSAGDFVKCSVSGDVIALSELKYWNVERQEAYANSEAALKRYLEISGRTR